MPSPLARAVGVAMLGVAACLFAPAQAANADGTHVEVFTEEVIVTARKLEENLQEVPIAVTAIPGELLEDGGALDISEIQPFVPNLSIYPGRNQSTTLTAFMRGVGQADPLWGVDPGVGLYLDEVYIARSQGALLDVFDVERIEVLRGPQGTLYGKNTVGGAIKYISRPLTDETTGAISVSAGDYSALDVKASFGGALVPGKLRAKVAVASLTHDGYGTNLFTGRDVSDKDTLVTRLALDWLASDNVAVKLRLDRTNDDSEPKGLTRLEENPLCLSLRPDPCPPLPPFDTESGVEPLNGTDSEGASMTLDWQIDERWRLKSITAYRESDSRNNIDFDTTPLPISDIEASYFDDQTSQEIQLFYDGSGPLQGVFGLYYFDGTAGGGAQNNIFDSFFVAFEGTTNTDSISVFGNGSYAISDKLSVDFGLRLTEEEKRVVAFNAAYTDATFSTVEEPNADYDESRTFSSVAPKLGLGYAWNDDVMGYVSLSRGFKSGGFNIRAGSPTSPEVPQTFDDEVLTVAEIGIKSRVATSLMLNAAAFHGDYEDVQVSTFTSIDSDGDGVDDVPVASFVNAGNATIKGLELEFNWNSRTIDWLGISGNLSYLDGSPDGFLDENDDGFLDSQVLTNSPEFAGALNLNIDFPALGGLVTGRVGYSYRDDSVLTNEGGPDPRDPSQPLLPLVQPSFGLISAWVSWQSGAGNWQFAIHGKNLGDEEYLTNGYNIPALGIILGSYGAPRTLAATVKYNF